MQKQKTIFKIDMPKNIFFFKYKNISLEVCKLKLSKLSLEKAKTLK